MPTTAAMPKSELVGFADDVMERFNNPFIKHSLLSIALNSISKFKVRILPSLLDYIEIFGKEPECLVMSLAALIEFCKSDYANDDRDLLELIRNSDTEKILSSVECWERDISFLTASVNKYITLIKKDGIRAAIKAAVEN